MWGEDAGEKRGRKLFFIFWRAAQSAAILLATFTLLACNAMLS